MLLNQSKQQELQVQGLLSTITQNFGFLFHDFGLCTKTDGGARALSMADRGALLVRTRHASPWDAYLDEKVQEANQAALGLPNALRYLVSAQLRVGLEAHLEPCRGRPMCE